MDDVYTHALMCVHCFAYHKGTAVCTRELNEIIYITSQVVHVMSFCFLSVKYLLFCYPLIPVANIEKRS